MARCANCWHLLPQALIFSIVQQLASAAQLTSDRNVEIRVDKDGNPEMQSRLLRSERNERAVEFNHDGNNGVVHRSFVEIDGRRGEGVATLALTLGAKPSKIIQKETQNNKKDALQNQTEEAEKEEGDETEEPKATTDVPNVNCQWKDWSAWTECPVSCGGGAKKERTRDIKVQQSGNGKECPGKSTEEKECNLQECPIDCQFSDWSSWSACEPFCSGTRQRKRTVTQQMQNGGLPCVNLTDVENCKNQCLDCSWSKWTEWADCSKTCGQATTHRSRNQTYAPRGEATSASLLQLDAGLQEIAYEKRMDVKCDSDHMRTLDLAAVSNGKTLSVGQLRLAAEKACREDPDCGGVYEVGCNGTFFACVKEFTLEYEPGSCSYTKMDIGEGTKCSGASTEVKQCGGQPCPVDCAYSDWKDWGDCEPFCDGKQTRLRDIKAKAQNGGLPCDEVSEGRSCSNICVDCTWSLWSDWSECSKPCAGGEHNRTRLVTTPAQGMGKNCTGNAKSTGVCNMQPCPVDCVTSPWTDWTPCSPYCSGTQARSRNLTSPEMHGGSCPPLEQARDCANLCMDCQLGDWANWSECSISCGGGQMSRSRTEAYIQRKESSLLQLASVEKAWAYAKRFGFKCDVTHQGQTDSAGKTLEEAKKACNADPQCVGLYDKSCDNFMTVCLQGFSLESEADSCVYEKKEIGGGQPCDGNVVEHEECNAELCPVDCVYNDWSAWEDCIPSCNGTQSRNRTVKVPASNGGAECSYVSDSQKCNTHPCPTDCVQSEWADWTECSPFCAGEQTRTRSIVTPAINGGQPCGVASELRNCSNVCQDCNWTEWTAWSDCNATCGISSRQRFRGIDRPRIGLGANCSGEAEQSLECDLQACAVDCEMTDWTPWSECVPICNGSQARSRNITVQPNIFGKNCSELYQKENCSTACVDCELGEWTEWGSCSASCGGGTSKRFKAIRFPAQGNGKACPSSNDTRICADDPCPVNCMWYDWGDWNGCSVSCGEGTRPRTRQKQLLAKHGGDDCVGNESEIQPCGEPCPQDCKWAEWMDWEACKVTCGGSERIRFRIHAQQAVGDGFNCSGENFERGVCGDDSCPKDCSFLNWTDWSSCSVSCGQGFQTSTREMDYEQFGGRPCDGSVFQTRDCSPGPCPQNCEWGGWDPWSHCTKNCKESAISGPGSTVRHRQKRIQAAFNGTDCDGNDTESQPCCRNDCEWQPWNDWGACVFNCGHAPFRHRSRPKVKAGPGGIDCDGPSNETGLCETDKPCSQNCIWDEWQEWTSCSATCGLSVKRLRHRGKVHEALGPEGVHCTGPGFEEASCNLSIECPVDCSWGEWGPWSDCWALHSDNVEGKRVQSRVRHPAAHGGASCSGDATVVEYCTLNATVEQLLAKSDVAISIKQSVHVTDPDQFQDDVEAMKAIQASAAKALGVEPDSIVIRFMHATHGAQTSGSAALLAEAEQGSEEDTQDDDVVDVEYDVLPPGQDYDQFYNATTHLNTTQVNNDLQQELQNRGTTYQARVEEFDISEIKPETRKKLKEMTLRSLAQTHCTYCFRSSVVLVFVAAFSAA